MRLLGFITALILVPALAFAQGAAVVGDVSVGGQLTVKSTAASTSPTTGAVQITGGLGVNGALNVGGVFSNSPALTLGSSYSAGESAVYHNLTASGTITGTNTLFLPSGHAWPFLYDGCSDTATESGGSQSNPLIADCRAINFTGLGVGTGDRNALDIGMVVSGTSAQTEGDAYFGGAGVTTSLQSNIGGTSAARVGDYYPFFGQTTFFGGATYWASVHDVGEFDLAIESGASVGNKEGLEINLAKGDASQGANTDAGIIFTDYGNTNWVYGIEFGLPAGQGGSFPISGTLMGSYVGGAATSGIDLHNILFSGTALSLPGFIVWGSGHVGSANNPYGSPTIASCGTSASLSTNSSDTRGVVNTGTGTVTSCTVNFAQPFANAPGGIPNCVLQGMGNFQSPWPTYPNSQTLVINFAASEPSESVIYHCWE